MDARIYRGFIVTATLLLGFAWLAWGQAAPALGPDGVQYILDTGFWPKVWNKLPGAVVGVGTFAVVLSLWLAFDRVCLRHQNIMQQIKQRNYGWAFIMGMTLFGALILASFASAAQGAPRAVLMLKCHKEWEQRFGGTVEWRYCPAQIQQESAWRMDAVSPVGAMGCLQFMPMTAKQFGLDPWDCMASIEAAGVYMVWLHGNWNPKLRQPLDRYWLALGGYNFGLGGMLAAQREAQRRGLNGNSWPDIAAYLPRETAEYAPRIYRHCTRMVQGHCHTWGAG